MKPMFGGASTFNGDLQLDGSEWLVISWLAGEAEEKGSGPSRAKSRRPSPKAKPFASLKLFKNSAVAPNGLNEKYIPRKYLLKKGFSAQ